jgi:hypothetical protein
MSGEGLFSSCIPVHVFFFSVLFRFTRKEHMERTLIDLTEIELFRLFVEMVYD